MRTSFERVIELLKEYKDEFGNLLVPTSYCTATGIKLGNIVNSIRSGGRKTTVEEKARLDEIGFVWQCRDVVPFKNVILLLEEYKREHGNVLVPAKYCTDTGVKLGRIVNSIRTGLRKLTADEVEQLNELGFVWKCHTKVSFKKVIKMLIKYKEEFGDLLVPVKYINADGVRLGSIVSSIRSGNRKTTIEEKAKLDELGFVWKVS